MVDLSVGASFVVKGTTMELEIGSSDVKAILVEDPDIVVGEAATEKLAASDGSSYSYAGQEGENTVSFPCVATDNAVARLLDAVYGTSSLVTDVNEAIGGTGSAVYWDLTNAGGTVRDIHFTTPATNNNKAMKIIAKNAKGLVVTPQAPLGSGWRLNAKFTCDYWRLVHDTDTTS